MDSKIQVVTHNGGFHADELLACAILSITYGQENVCITRTRDNEILTKATQDENVWVIDVGGEYNPSMLNFDHHMRDFSLTNSFGNKLSSFGMVVEALLNRSFFSEVKDSLLTFANKVDKMDNGIEKVKELSFITVFNSFSTDESLSFNKALEVAIIYLQSIINKWEEESAINARVNNAIANMTTDGIIFSEEYIPVDERANNIAEAKLVIYKAKTGSYNIQSVNVGQQKDFTVRTPAPKAWKGLSDSELVRVSGGLPLTFCHAGGFLTVTSTSDIEEALRIARIILLG